MMVTGGLTQQHCSRVTATDCAAHPMCVNMFLLPGSHAFANPKSHSLMRCGRLESSSVLSSFRSLDAGTAWSATVHAPLDNAKTASSKPACG